jgi:hypothetical protein
VNLGGEPERDESGLPPVDIEIPDDARELDRDVQAYYREQRAERRHQRSLRMRGSLTRDGIVLPLLACCLIFALISGTLLTVFTATSGTDQGLPGVPVAGGHTAGKPSTGGSTASAGKPARAGLASPHVQPGRRLPAITIAVYRHAPLALRQLGPAVLLLVPADCSCLGAIRQLAALSEGNGVAAYLVGSGAAMPQTEKLAGQVGHGVVAADDQHGAVRASYPHTGLTAILVARGGGVSYANMLQNRVDLSGLLKAADI